MNSVRFRLVHHYIVKLLIGWLGIGSPLFAQTPVSAPDTIRQSLAQLDQQFLDRNFQLLAQRYQIDVASANIIQAGLRPNPNLSVQTNLFNPNTGKVLPLATPSATDLSNGVYNSGYFSVQLQQVILLAGKRSKLVALAESNRTLSQLAFRDILRTLRYQLHTTYANLYYDLQALALFRAEEARQVRLVESSRIALSSGGIAPYEVTRLEVALRDLRASIADYQAQISDSQSTLHILLRQTGNSFILPATPPILENTLPVLALAIDSALTNRPDNALAQEQINTAQRSLALEKARRTPDLTTGVLFERYGNAYVNFVALQAGIDLPVRNRNQGAIKAAETNLKASQAGTENQQVVVQNEVLNAYTKLQNYYSQQATLPADYTARLQNISFEATKAYNSRTIGLLDYLDKIRTYQQGQLTLINLRNNVFQTQQLFNYVTNTRFF